MRVARNERGETPREEITREIAECRRQLLWQQQQQRLETGRAEQMVEAVCGRCGGAWIDYDTVVDDLMLRFIAHIRTKHPEAMAG